MLSKTQIKYIQSLYHKKFREQYGQYLIEGPKMLSEAIIFQQEDICFIYALPDWAAQNAEVIKKFGTTVILVNVDEMGKISTLTTPGPVMAIMAMRAKPPVSSFPGITLLLDAIQDPGNLGTIIRTADWFGVQHIIFGEGCADLYNPKVIQSTMGSIFRMNFTFQNLSSFLALWPDLPVLVSSLEGCPLDEAKKPGQAFLVIGNESRGVSQNIVKYASQNICIPGNGNAESLNAAVAAGILLYWLKAK
jgi:RNA methyltransferase, TrmH family